MEKHIPTVYYHSGTGNSLTISNKFVYYVEVYRVNKNSFNLESTSYFSISDITNIKQRTVSILDNGDKIIRELELISAPEQYLIDNNYIKNEN